jgi:hypothetical protein
MMRREIENGSTMMRFDFNMDNIRERLTKVIAIDVKIEEVLTKH